MDNAKSETNKSSKALETEKKALKKERGILARVRGNRDELNEKLIGAEASSSCCLSHASEIDDTLKATTAENSQLQDTVRQAGLNKVKAEAIITGLRTQLSSLQLQADFVQARSNVTVTGVRNELMNVQYRAQDDKEQFETTIIYLQKRLSSLQLQADAGMARSNTTITELRNELASVQNQTDTDKEQFKATTTRLCDQLVDLQNDAGTNKAAHETAIRSLKDDNEILKESNARFHDYIVDLEVQKDQAEQIVTDPHERVFTLEGTAMQTSIDTALQKRNTDFAHAQISTENVRTLATDLATADGCKVRLKQKLSTLGVAVINSRSELEEQASASSILSHRLWQANNSNAVLEEQIDFLNTKHEQGEARLQGEVSALKDAIDNSNAEHQEKVSTLSSKHEQEEVRL